ncbi:S-layer homology domain-containing protein (plasmid) [Pontibacillus sp. ALD_SL1]|uniref:S-layer homology domain-containing protein n=1 Tax=Pontibacillus sp. ALD_SL1 TaxID=2777185 RepID=UPI001A96E351|nr:S-layer homology domain-containing protein [Pontibacillus sp. ALD_SL1]QST02432.1 S-layer homology domain-containing protein [Pontibacillus sp. ALD_SL1]
MKRNIKYWMVGLVILFVITGGGKAFATVQTFKDVAPSYWAYVPIEWGAENGVIRGYPDGTFRATEPLEEVHIVRIVANAINDGHLVIDGEDASSYEYYQWMRDQGVPLGDFENRDHHVTRGEMAVILVSALQREPKTLEEAVDYLFEKGITDGFYTTGSMMERYAPEKTLTRAQAMVFMMRVYENMPVTPVVESIR